MLIGFLDWYRSVARQKLDGLTLSEATSVTTPTGLSLLGIVKHLTWVERRWFRDTFVGEDGSAVDIDGSFRLEASDTVDSVVDEYRRECEHARRVVDETPSLDTLSARAHAHFGTVSLRWTLVHMIEETARHAGHLDILRELTDGRTGN